MISQPVSITRVTGQKHWSLGPLTVKVFLVCSPSATVLIQSSPSLDTMLSDKFDNQLNILRSTGVMELTVKILKTVVCLSVTVPIKSLQNVDTTFIDKISSLITSQIFIEAQKLWAFHCEYFAKTNFVRSLP